MANHWKAAHPQSRFVLGPIISRVLPAGFVALSGTQLSVADGGDAYTRQLESAAEWRDVLASHLGLDVPLADVEALKLFPR